MKINFTEIFHEFYQKASALIPNILMGLIVIVIFIGLGKLFYRLVGRRIQSKWKESIISSFISEATKWFFYLFGLIIALNLIGFGGVASSLIAGAGIGAIIFGFAFKDIGENFLAGIILALKRPFEIGDIIEVDGQKGSVRDLDLRITHLRNAEGKDIFIPNSAIIKNTLINYTKDGNLRVSFMIGIAPECDIWRTKELIMDYLMKSERILNQPKPNVVVTNLGEFTTDLQVLFWVDILANQKLPDSNLGHNIRSTIITEVKKILDDNEIEMPSQVLEHKMYRDQSVRVKTDEASKNL